VFLEFDEADGHTLGWSQEYPGFRMGSYFLLSTEMIAGLEG
jgi:hypothetical protein